MVLIAEYEQLNQDTWRTWGDGPRIEEILIDDAVDVKSSVFVIKGTGLQKRVVKVHTILPEGGMPDDFNVIHYLEVSDRVIEQTYHSRPVVKRSPACTIAAW